jgi:hypothetical protein
MDRRVGDDPKYKGPERRHDYPRREQPAGVEAARAA